MLIQILYPYIRFALGTLYPAYKTWKALKRKDETTRRRWMKYWVSFGAFQLFEFVADITLVFILPFYIELKLAALVWLVLGTKLIFDSIVNRELAKREKSIDRWLNKTTKVRDELVAMIWYEISRCSIKIVTSLMSGGLSVLAKSPEQQSNHASPVCSDGEEEEDGQAAITDNDQQNTTVCYIDEPDFNENSVSMEWSVTNIPAIDAVKGNSKDNNERRLTSIVAIRKSARRELMSLKSSTNEIE